MDILLICGVLTHTVISLLGIFVNGLLVYLITRKTPKELRTYSVLILNFAVCDLLACFSSLFVLQRYFEGYVVLSEGYEPEEAIREKVVQIFDYDISSECALTYQTFIPSVFCLAVVTYFLGQLRILNHPVLEYSTFIIIGLVPILSSLVSIYFIRPYREWVEKNLLRSLSSTKISISTMSSTELSQRF
ncbi:hypothetical protein OESDEN_09751 [Oesophagostomum dentatum]|uniref:G-protein coupled receptors family 1 profile domain-containing protein n=1 Tax=Oesophagostomum dentatum TaxID=61180 RepID=A0A0B1T2L8_OESDE|nr:hypothetical protein OESDEN_09751 [Oesophagostomum dentatum]